MIGHAGAVKAVDNAVVKGRTAPEQLRRAREHEARQYLTEQMAMPAHRVAEIDPDIAAWSAKASASYARRCATTKQN